MRKAWNWYRSVSAILLLFLSFGVFLLSKLIELKFENIAMGFQLVGFFFLLSGLFRFFDSIIFKK